MAQENKIIIKFVPQGSQHLLKAIKKLTDAQRKLENNLNSSKLASEKFAKSQHLVSHRMSANTKTAGLLSAKFATLRNKMLLYMN